MMTSAAAITLGLCLLPTALVAAKPLTTMPTSYPSDPKDYLSKWDPFALKPVTAFDKTLFRNNGRQIARDSTGAWFVLLEWNQQAILLGTARGGRVLGGDFAMMELVGASVCGTFGSQGVVTGASMVMDRNDTLHVVWCDQEALMVASRPVGTATVAQLRDPKGWTAPKTSGGEALSSW